jgi:hypothetical protein
MLGKTLPAALTVAIGAAIAPAAAAAGPAPPDPPSCRVTPATPYTTTDGTTAYRYGTRRLWGFIPTRDGIVRARRDGVSPALRSDGSVGSKVLWGSETERRVLRLRVSGHRVDAPGEGMGLRTVARSRIWPSSVIWPSLGCWKMNARLGDVRVAFTVNVVAPE